MYFFYGQQISKWKIKMEETCLKIVLTIIKRWSIVCDEINQNKNNSWIVKFEKLDSADNTSLHNITWQVADIKTITFFKPKKNNVQNQETENLL